MEFIILIIIIFFLYSYYNKEEKQRIEKTKDLLNQEFDKNKKGLKK